MLWPVLDTSSRPVRQRGQVGVWGCRPYEELGASFGS